MAASRKPSPTKPEDAPQQPPTLETLKLLETDLYELVQKKIDLEKSLSQIEANIYAVEGAYLEDSLYGNIVRGYEGYANTRVARKGRPKDSDRIFSQSSVAYLKVTLVSCRSTKTTTEAFSTITTARRRTSTNHQSKEEGSTSSSLPACSSVSI